jgi:hypothetical protein
MYSPVSWNFWNASSAVLKGMWEGAPYVRWEGTAGGGLGPAVRLGRGY